MNLQPITLKYQLDFFSDKTALKIIFSKIWTCYLAISTALTFLREKGCFQFKHKQHYIGMVTQNGLYGCIAGVVNAAILQPLDNIKMGLIVPPKELPLSNNFINNLPRVFKYLWHYQGIQGFYKGLVPNILKTGFSSAFYFYLLRQMEYNINEQNPFNSFTISCFARIVSTIVGNPFAVIETRYEIPGQNRWKGTILESFRKMYQKEGNRGFFKGCLASCIKEGSFAGIYYAIYVEGKSKGYSAWTAGMVAGLISTLSTHPFQLLKTIMQVQVLERQKQVLSLGFSQQLTIIARNGDLLKGVAPRLMKKPLANTITFMMFEAMQRKETD